MQCSKEFQNAGAPGVLFNSQKDCYKNLYVNVIDEASGDIEGRFDGKGYQILLTCERILLCSFAGKVLNVDDLKLIEDHIQDDLDFRRFPAQLQVLSNLRLESVKTFTQVVDECARWVVKPS